MIMGAKMNHIYQAMISSPVGLWILIHAGVNFVLMILITTHETRRDGYTAIGDLLTNCFIWLLSIIPGINVIITYTTIADLYRHHIAGWMNIKIFKNGDVK